MTRITAREEKNAHVTTWTDHIVVFTFVVQTFPCSTIIRKREHFSWPPWSAWQSQPNSVRHPTLAFRKLSHLAFETTFANRRPRRVATPGLCRSSGAAWTWTPCAWATSTKISSSISSWDRSFNGLGTTTEEIWPSFWRVCACVSSTLAILSHNAESNCQSPLAGTPQVWRMVVRGRPRHVQGLERLPTTLRIAWRGRVSPHEPNVGRRIALSGPKSANHLLARVLATPPSWQPAWCERKLGSLDQGSAEIVRARRSSFRNPASTSIWASCFYLVPPRRPLIPAQGAPSKTSRAPTWWTRGLPLQPRFLGQPSTCHCARAERPRTSVGFEWQVSFVFLSFALGANSFRQTPAALSWKPRQSRRDLEMRLHMAEPPIIEVCIRTADASLLQRHRHADDSQGEG